MLGQDFTPRVVYRDGERWLRVRTRGPVITRGVATATVRLTAEDAEGTVCRAKVHAATDYPTAGAFPAALDDGLVHAATG
ncbi:hypothetical protein [Prauserella muralis]|nr:hypothetical protein [Prauserella muralis]TWE29428.1 hypothetical protein FHX69_2113 [Prauserella muralis]